MKNRFLFELGLEEIPADMIKPAAEQLRAAVGALLQDNALERESLEVFGAPRRLAFLIEGIADRQADREELILGPPKSVAFDAHGVAAPPALGFARKMGVPADQLKLVPTDRGEYVGVRRLLEGKRTTDILKEGLPRIIASISWPKNMYWQESRFRFVRPIRWLVALWNDEVIPVEFEGLTAGSTTRGHRFLGNSDVQLSSAQDYVARLREQFVLVDVDERAAKIKRELEQELPAGCRMVDDPDLLEQVAYLNEYPSVLLGGFNPEFLKIPQEILITVMRHHQKYFAVVGGDEALKPHFLTVLNTSGDPVGQIRLGHEKVLRARLEDAAFFWATDQKSRLEDRRPMLDSVLFQEKLGSYGAKTERVRQICGSLSKDESLERAALLSKCDLVTDMVREFPELQGVMGGLYARGEGEPESVWKAIYEHYKPVSLEDSSPGTENGALLSIADKIDTVVGCFGIGIIPSGSSDPFALRRQAQGIVKVLFDRRLDGLTLATLIDAAAANHKPTRPVEDVRRDVLDFLQARVRFVLQEQGIAVDALNAVMAVGVDSVHKTYRKAAALAEIRHEADFEALAIAFKRIKNILAKQEIGVDRVTENDLEHSSEKELFAVFAKLRPQVLEELQADDYGSALRRIATLRNPVDRFFDGVMVLTEDSRLRNNRLRLLFEISQLFLMIADISEIQESGDRGNREEAGA